MSIYKSDFLPTMKRLAWMLEAVLLFTGLTFVIRTFALQSFGEQMASLFFGIVLIVIYVYMLAVIPTAILLDDDMLVIKRIFNRKCIPYSAIKDVFIYNEVQGDVRYFGSNGFLGYMGVMGSTRYGKYCSYVKNPKQQVFVMTQNKNYLLSCEDRDSFVKELSGKISSADKT